MKEYEQRKWYFKNAQTFEVFNILYDDSRYMLVQSDETKEFSFGMSNDFNTLYGFAVNQSCLTKAETIAILRRFIEIDKKHPDLREIEKSLYGYSNIDVWETMINELNKVGSE